MISNKFLYSFPEFGILISRFNIADQFSRVFGSFTRFHNSIFNRIDLKILELLGNFSYNTGNSKRGSFADGNENKIYDKVITYEHLRKFVEGGI
jgi:hypothetical protein